MEQKSINSKDRLKWYLKFLNLKIEQLSEKELFGIWAEIRKVVYEEYGPSIMPDASLVAWEERRKQAGAIQDLLKNSLKKIMNPTLISLTLKKPLKKIDIASSHPKPTEGTEYELPNNILRHHAFTQHFEIKVMAMDQKVFIYFPKLEDKLLLDFTSLLEEFPLNLIRRCQREDCGAYFLKGTKREKRYCSDQCAWVLASRRRWAEKKFKDQGTSETPTVANQRVKRYRKIIPEEK